MSAPRTCSRPSHNSLRTRVTRGPGQSRTTNLERLSHEIDVPRTTTHETRLASELRIAHKRTVVCQSERAPAKR